MVYRTPPKCDKCGQEIEGIYRDQGENFVGDTFSHWDFGGHKCAPIPNDITLSEFINQLQKQVSEQSQRIEALTKENERLKEDSNKDLFVIGSQLQELERLREEKKELVEAINKRIYKYGVTLPASEKYFLRSLLSKFEVPNT